MCRARWSSCSLCCGHGAAARVGAVPARQARADARAARFTVPDPGRRVPGLRREEVAELALISDTYYTKLERGKVQGISAAVLDGLTLRARADSAGTRLRGQSDSGGRPRR
ncbi:MAG: helix-turn-helix domain-containing protein [Micropruina glycogenica]